MATSMDIYSTAWKILEHKMTATRRQSISKAELTKWQLQSLEEAVDRFNLATLYEELAAQRVFQETPKA